jgi:hypothetical protein
MSLVGLARHWLEDRRIRKLLRVARSYSLATLPESTIGRVVGVARPFEQRVLEAPLSGRICVYYVIELVELRPATPARLLATEQEGLSFVLEDDTGRAMIDPAHARCSCAFDHESESKAAFDADPRQRALLERHSLVRRDWFQTQGIRYREAAITIDERIAVLGAGVREPDPAVPPQGERGYRDDGPTRMRFTGTARYPLVLSDDPRSQ